MFGAERGISRRNLRTVEQGPIAEWLRKPEQMGRLRVARAVVSTVAWSNGEDDGDGRIGEQDRWLGDTPTGILPAVTGPLGDEDRDLRQQGTELGRGVDAERGQPKLRAHIRLQPALTPAADLPSIAVVRDGHLGIRRIGPGFCIGDVCHLGVGPDDLPPSGSGQPRGVGPGSAR